MNFSYLFLSSPTASNVVELGSIRNNIVICNTINNEDTYIILLYNNYFIEIKVKL